MYEGKPRSRFGEFIDKYLGYGGQEKLREYTKLNKDVISKACNEENPSLRRSTIVLLLSAVKELTGRNVDKKQFWG